MWLPAVNEWLAGVAGAIASPLILLAIAWLVRILILRRVRRRIDESSMTDRRLEQGDDSLPAFPERDSAPAPGEAGH